MDEMFVCSRCCHLYSSHSNIYHHQRACYKDCGDSFCRSVPPSDVRVLRFTDGRTNNPVYVSKSIFPSTLNDGVAKQVLGGGLMADLVRYRKKRKNEKVSFLSSFALANVCLPLLSLISRIRRRRSLPNARLQDVAVAYVLYDPRNLVIW